jgi:hypothetical protein
MIFNKHRKAVALVGLVSVLSIVLINCALNPADVDMNASIKLTKNIIFTPLFTNIVPASSGMLWAIDSSRLYLIDTSLSEGSPKWDPFYGAVRRCPGSVLREANLIIDAAGETIVKDDIGLWRLETQEDDFITKKPIFTPSFGRTFLPGSWCTDHQRGVLCLDMSPTGFVVKRWNGITLQTVVTDFWWGGLAANDIQNVLLAADSQRIVVAQHTKAGAICFYSYSQNKRIDSAKVAFTADPGEIQKMFLLDHEIYLYCTVPYPVSLPYIESDSAQEVHRESNTGYSLSNVIVRADSIGLFVIDGSYRTSGSVHGTVAILKSGSQSTVLSNSGGILFVTPTRVFMITLRNNSYQVPFYNQSDKLNLFDGHTQHIIDLSGVEPL